jgi:hypothetical protein
MEGQIREKADQAISEAKSLRTQILNAPDWRSLGENNDVQGFQREEGENVYVKGVCVINFPPDVIADFIWNNANRSKYEDDVGDIDILHTFGNTRVERFHKKMPLMIDDRETLCAIRRETDGDNILIIGRTIDIDVPVTEGRVRAINHINSYHLVDVEGIATEVTFIFGVDPKGNIPHSLITMLAGKAAFQLSKVRDSLQ